MDFKAFFRKKGAAADVGAERLQFILIQDRAMLSPGLMEQMKAELLAVIAKYYDIDAPNVKINTERAPSGKTTVETSVPIQRVHKTVE